MAGVAVKKCAWRSAGASPQSPGCQTQFTPLMDAPLNYGDAGEPASQGIRERCEYLQSVMEAEERRKLDHMLFSMGCTESGRRDQA
ncbi:hypothetical protein GGI35DRAFT_346626 [Trichoderma velutinum]